MDFERALWWRFYDDCAILVYCPFGKTLYRVKQRPMDPLVFPERALLAITTSPQSFKENKINEERNTDQISVEYSAMSLRQQYRSWSTGKRTDIQLSFYAYYIILLLYIGNECARCEMVNITRKCLKIRHVRTTQTAMATITQTIGTSSM